MMQTPAMISYDQMSSAFYTVHYMHPAPMPEDKSRGKEFPQMIGGRAIKR
jgi:hypothetical protein